jgi:hypothetical protein
VLSPIAFPEFDAQKYREFVRTLSDEALIRKGKKMRWLSGDGKIVSTMPSAFDEQLKSCREEAEACERSPLILQIGLLVDGLPQFLQTSACPS